MNASNVVITTRDQRCSVNTNKPTVLSMPSRGTNEVCLILSSVNILLILKKPTVSGVGNISKVDDLFKRLADNERLGFPGRAIFKPWKVQGLAKN